MDEGRRSRMRPGARALAWGALAAYSALVFYLSSLPLDAIPSLGFSLNDKLVHLKVYFGWGVLCTWALRTSFPSLGSGRLVFWAALGGALYGLSDEIHQMFVPGRAAELEDLAADAAGATLGACASLGLRWAVVRFRRSEPEATRGQNSTLARGPVEAGASAPEPAGAPDGRE